MQNGDQPSRGGPGPQKTFDGVTTERLVDAENMAENLGTQAAKTANGEATRLRQRQGSPTRAAMRDVTARMNSPTKGDREEDKEEIAAMAADVEDCLIDGITPAATPLATPIPTPREATTDQEEIEDSGVTYKKLFELKSRISKSIRTFEKEFAERKKSFKQTVKKINKELDQPNEGSTSFAQDVQALRSQMQHVDTIIQTSAQETEALNTRCSQLRQDLTATSTRGAEVMKDIQDSIEKETSTRRQLLQDKEQLTEEVRELATTLESMRLQLEDNERVSLEHAQALGCAGMQGNHILRKELAALNHREDSEEAKKLQDQIKAESNSVSNSKKALEAKESDKEEVESLIKALKSKRASVTDVDEISAIDSELECAKQRLNLVHNACSAITRCIEQHNQRIDKFNSRLIDIKRDQQHEHPELPSATPRELISAQVSTVAADSSLMASSIVAPQEPELQPELSEEAVAKAKRDQLKETLENKDGLLSELKLWVEQLEAKITKLVESGESDVEDELNTMRDELESVQMKIKQNEKVVFDLEGQIQQLELQQ